jgi:type I restriction enzyme R subunit
LLSFDDFANNELISQADYQDFQSTYILLYQKFRDIEKADKESIIEDLIFEIELVKQVEINVDFILILIKSLQGASASENKEIKAKISKSILSSYSLRSKKDLIEQFVDSINNNTDVDTYWKEFISEQRKLELKTIIEQENLDPAKTEEFITQAFFEGQIKSIGTSITKLLPAKNMFSPSYEHSLQKSLVIQKLSGFFERFSNL